MYAGNDKMFDGILISALSTIKHNKCPFHVYILTMKYEDFSPFSESQRAFIEKIYQSANKKSKVFIIDVKEHFLKHLSNSANAKTDYTPYSFLRLFADRLDLPEKVLYLDTDTVVNGDLSELFNTDLKGFEYGAVLDYYGKYFMGYHYINSGVMLLNLPEIRKTGLFEKAVKLCAEKRLFLPDQTAIHRLTTNKLILPRKFNEQKDYNSDDTVIQHFTKTILWLPYFHTRNIKPWNTALVKEFLTDKYNDILNEYELQKFKFEEKNMNKNDKITVFYACDNEYIPYLAVSLHSLIENSDKNKHYEIVILQNEISEKNQKIISDFATDNVKIKFKDVSNRLKTIADKLSLRDYYSLSIYFRIFIPEMFSNIDKAVYIDCDTVVLSDIAELYHTNLEGNLVAAATDMVVISDDTFVDYVENAVGVEDSKKYFNSGVMVMNLEAMRNEDLLGNFTYLLNTYEFETVAPDQDYLNVICRNRVKYISKSWNKMSIDSTNPDNINLVHYNMYFKPWFYDDVLYNEYFWEYAKGTPFYDLLRLQLETFDDEGKKANEEANKFLRQTAKRITESPNNFNKILFAKEAVV